MELRLSRFGSAAAIGSILVASMGAPTFAQDTSAPPSEPPAASGAPGQDPCARFRQDAAAGGAPNVAAIALAQEVTTPGEEAAPVDPYQCTLPAWDPSEAWPFGGRVDTAQAFHWSLPRTEGVPADGDIVGVGWVPIRLNGRQARQIRDADVFTTSGPENRTIRNGDYVLIQIETAEVPTPGGDVNRGFHLGTDADGKRSNNVPATVEDPDSVFQDLQNVYTLYQTAGRDAPTLGSTDFGSGKPGVDGTVWYNDNERFAGRVTESPPGVQFLVRKNALGDGFRPFMIGPAPTGARPRGVASIVGTDLPAPMTLDQGGFAPSFPPGTDVGTPGTLQDQFPTDGRTSAAIAAIWLGLDHEPPPFPIILTAPSGPLTFPCLSRTPLLWISPIAPQSQAVVTDWFAQQTPDEHGFVELPLLLDTTIDGSPITQETIVDIALLGDGLGFGTLVCLTGYGSYQVTGVEFPEPSDPAVAGILNEMADSILGPLPGWRVGEQEGRAAGPPLPEEAEEVEALLDFFVDAFKPPPQ